jgi:hypothetical protein
LLLAGGLAHGQQLPPPPGPAPAFLPSLPAVPAPPMKKLTLHKAAGSVRPAAAATSNVRPTQYTGGGRAPAGVGAEQIDYLIQLLPGSLERISRIKSEDELREQIRQEAREQAPPTRAVFPEEREVTGAKFTDHTFPPQVALAEPYYVNYNRLFFQDLNSERYGWELGFVQPLVSTGLFFTDLALVPYHWASRPFDCVQSSAGYCLPGDPVPYLCYPPNLSVTGGLAEVAAVVGVLAIFP